MVDLLGPGDAGASPVLTTTSDVTNVTAGDTYLQNCVANTPGTGTPLVAKFLNRFLQQMRRVIRLSGIPLSNPDDDMLGQAIQSGATNWVGTAGGATNAWTCNLSPAPTALLAGTVVRGLAPFTNTGALTLNCNSLGAISVTHANNFSPLTGYEFVVGQEFEFTYDGAGWRVTSPILPAAQWAVFAGTANALTAVLVPAPTLVAGLEVRGQAPYANTGPATFSYNGGAAIAILRSDGVALGGGEILAGAPIVIVYNGGSWFLESALPVAFSNYQAELYIEGPVQSGAWNWGALGGTTNAWTCTLTPAPTALTAGLVVRGLAPFTNTGALTLNVNGLGAVSVTHANNFSALTGYEFVVGQEFEAVYDGTGWRANSSLLAPAVWAGTLTGTANAPIATLEPAPTLAAGLVIRAQAAYANTGAMTLTVGGTTLSVLRSDASALVGGEIAVNQIVEFVLAVSAGAWELISQYAVPFFTTPQQVQAGSYNWGTTGGTANALTITLSPAPTIAAGFEVRSEAAYTNTGAATLAVNGGAAMPIARSDGAALVGGEIIAGARIVLVYNGASWFLESALPVAFSNQKAETYIAPTAQSGAWNWGPLSGTTNAWTATLTPAPTALTAGLVVRGLAPFTNTAALTLNVNGLGAVSVTRGNNFSALSGYEFVVGQEFEAVYDGTGWRAIGAILPGSQWAAIGGTNNALTATLQPAPTLAAGLKISGIAAANNNNATTLAINGGSAIAVVQATGGALEGGEILAGALVEFEYTGSEWIITGRNDAWNGDNCGSLNLGTGYQIFAGGIIIQWGQVSLTGGADTSDDFVLPVTFPNGPLWGIGSDTGSSAGGSPYSQFNIISWDRSDGRSSKTRFYKSGSPQSVASVMVVGH